MSDRIIGIPDDFEEVPGALYTLAGDLPDLWHQRYYDIAEIHGKFRELGVEPGAGETIAINDTGKTVHDLLPEPIAERSFIRSESVTATNLHGPHCAGIALGRDGLGVAPGANLIVGKVLSNGGSGSTQGINAGRVWAAEAGATVISESLGDGGGPDIREDIEAYDKAYEAGASLCIAALGNSGPQGVGRPGSYKQSCGVANHREDGTIAPSSSRGPTADLTGPGTNIISCNTRNGLQALTGTSMATPFVAGCFALIRHWMRVTGKPVPQGHEAWRTWWQDPEFTKDVGRPGHDTSFGDGVLRIDNILKVIKNSTWACILIACGLFATMPSSSFAQEIVSLTERLAIDTEQVEIETVTQTLTRTSVRFADTALEAPVETITGEKVAVENAVLISASDEVRKVTAFTTDFNLGTLVKTGRGYILTGVPGRYLVTIYTESEFEQLVVELEASIPPVDTSQLVAELKRLLPDDSLISSSLAAAYRLEIDNSGGKTLAEFRKSLGLARVRVLSLDRDTSKDWNSFLLAIDKWASANNPDLEAYKIAMGDVVSVLKSEPSVSTIVDKQRMVAPAEPTFKSLRTWLPPPKPWILGQVHQGRTLSQQCNGTQCELVWVPR